MKNDKIHYVLYNFANDKKRMLKLKVKINQFGYFKNNPVLKNIEINIKEHDIVAIVGKNGSGKTTLLKIMDGLLKDFSGEVLVDGENVKSLTPRQIYSKMGRSFSES
jgi:ABC-type cobalamin/Fe3+-siderophores transport systems, ATPase components